MLSVVNNDEAGAEARSGLAEICREGARTMLAAALEAEVEAYLAELIDAPDEAGHRLVTRDGHARSRKVQTAPVTSATSQKAPCPRSTRAGVTHSICKSHQMDHAAT